MEIFATIASNEATPTVYTQAAGNIEGITTLGTYAAPTENKCRFKEIDATNLPGWYELQLADARFAVASATQLGISLHGATDMAETDAEVQLMRQDQWIKKLLLADKMTDTGTTPWDLVHIEQGTGAIGVGTELLRQELTQADDTNVTSTDHVVGNAIA